MKMLCILSAAESAIVLYCKILIIVVFAPRPSDSHADGQQLSSDQAARKRARQCWTIQAAIGRLQFVVRPY